MYGDLHGVPAEVKGFGRMNGCLASLGTIKDLSIFAIAYVRTPGVIHTVILYLVTLMVYKSCIGTYM